MNTRSLSFRLTLWYAGVLTWVFTVLGGVTYLALKTYLEGSIRDAQMRRARQIAGVLLPGIRHQGEARLIEEIKARYAPEVNGQFIRLSDDTGLVFYLSGTPRDRSFDPSAIPRPSWPSTAESTRRQSLPDGRALLMATVILTASEGNRYLVESGASTDSAGAVLGHFLMVLVIGLPVVAATVAAGGYFLVKRALAPVSEITVSSERITFQNLSERLPVARTGDELEHLSVALNRMMTRLDDAFQYSRRFVADASHELRTPLTVLRGELEALLQNESLGADVRDTAASLLEEVERLTNIVEGLFALSRLDAGEAQREWLPFDLGLLALSTADQMSLLAEDKRISVNTEFAGDVIIQGDRSRLKQVVVNLLDNAIKYTPEGGVITLKVKSTDDLAVLEVADTGIGIPAESLPHVFERFYRVDKARSRDIGGAGLGLAIAKAICTAHGVTLAVSSTPGHGSTFRLEFRQAPTAPIDKALS